MASSTSLLHLSYEFLGGSPNISCHEQFWNGKLDGSSWTSCLERSSFVALTRRGEPWQALSGYHRCQWRDQLDLEHHHLLPKPMLPLPMGPLRQALVRRLQLLWAVVLGLGLLALRRGVRIGPPRRVPTSGLLYITTSWSLETTPTSAPPPEQAQSRKILFLIEKTFPAKVSVSRFEKQDL